MKSVLLTMGLLCAGSDAFALLGDTRAAADGRYGVARLESPAIREKPLIEGAHHALYHFEGFEIYCAFLKATDGQSYCVGERYERLPAPTGSSLPKRDLEDYEVNAVLTTQGGGTAWKKSDRKSLANTAPEWIQESLRSYRISTLWTRKDGALAEVGIGNRWVTFTHPQALIHKTQMKRGGAASEMAAVQQFIATIADAHRVPPPDAGHRTLSTQTAPSTGAGSATISKPYSQTEGVSAPRATTVPQQPQTNPKKASDDVKNTLGNVGVVGVVVIGLVRILVAGLKGTSRRERKRSPLRQSASIARQQLRTEPARIVVPPPRRTLEDLEWDEFELLVGEIYRRQGYHVEISSGDGADGGIDLVLRRDSETVLVQCKHWQTSKVGAKEIREFYGVLVSERASRGIFVTTHEYSRDALEFAAGKPLELINRAGLAELIVTSQRAGMADILEVAEWAPFFKASSQVSVPACPFCKATMVLRNARSGAFWGCASYPRCRGTRKTKRYLVG